MLTRLTLLAAALDTPDEHALQDVARRSKPWFSSDTGLLMGALIVVFALAFFWVVFLRKRPTHTRGSLVVTRAQPGDNQRYGSSGRRRRRKRRPEHPDNLGRNPTLGETGGLPPPRPDEPDPPPSESAEPQR